MGEYVKGMFLGLGVGMAVGMIIVSKNKKLAGKISEGVDCAEEKLEKAKQAIGEKLEECGQKCDCEETNAGQSEQPKKSKNC